MKTQYGDAGDTDTQRKRYEFSSEYLKTIFYLTF